MNKNIIRVVMLFALLFSGCVQNNEMYMQAKKNESYVDIIGESKEDKPFWNDSIYFPIEIINIDGEDTKGWWSGSPSSVGVTPGEHTLRVKASFSANDYGHATLTFLAEEGEHYTIKRVWDEKIGIIITVHNSKDKIIDTQHAALISVRGVYVPML